MNRFIVWLVARLRSAALCISLIMTATFGVATGAAGEGLQTTREMTALPPAAANRTVRSNLLSVLEPISQRLSSGMSIRLRDVVMSTRPYGAEFKGLCQRDFLWLKYAPTESGPKARDQPLQAYGVEGHTAFHALRAPEPILTDTAATLNIWNEECDHLANNADANWFEARDAEEAARAITLLAAATKQIRAGALHSTSCDLFPTNHRTCDQTVLEEGEVSKINSVEACPTAEGSECLIIDVGNETALTIVGRTMSDPTTPGPVELVSVKQYIVVT